MQAMVFEAPGHLLRERDLPCPKPGAGQILVRVSACAICRTDLHLLDGELPRIRFPIIPGHQIVGRVEACGDGAGRFKLGDRVGLGWLGWTCGRCRYCQSGRENLCEEARFTGYTLDGGFAEFTVADERFCFALPETFADVAAAPLLCGGLIGYRCLRLTGEAKKLGLYGFGAAATLVAQIGRFQGREIFAFTREGDIAGQEFARSLGVVWAGASTALPPEPLDAAIIFAPAGNLVPLALAATGRGGTVVCGGIHMSEIPAFSYDLLWQERSLRSVANLTRGDGEEFLALAPKVPVRTTTKRFPLAAANAALAELRAGAFAGAAVLTIA